MKVDGEDWDWKELVESEWDHEDDDDLARALEQALPKTGAEAEPPLSDREWWEDNYGAGISKVHKSTLGGNTSVHFNDENDRRFPVHWINMALFMGSYRLGWLTLDQANRIRALTDDQRVAFIETLKARGFHI